MNNLPPPFDRNEPLLTID